MGGASGPIIKEDTSHSHDFHTLGVRGGGRGRPWNYRKWYKFENYHGCGRSGAAARKSSNIGAGPQNARATSAQPPHNLLRNLILDPEAFWETFGFPTAPIRAHLF